MEEELNLGTIFAEQSSEVFVLWKKILELQNQKKDAIRAVDKGKASEVLKELKEISVLIKQMNATLEVMINLTSPGGEFCSAQQQAVKSLGVWQRMTTDYTYD
eukprot:CAMPEP_0174266250 /NCGR_PEP_ID=MMETSP0439-20130205/29510_1 /TAXON_ID=0 /ORGANISM="Stereomyxa ramosa, Strain Chinc5" /LENGTH=102 /DNA_ID=CAMNT_0015353099 /DNA_START=28 /DNA_END=336 /DNA_ORIENTATION=+